MEINISISWEEIKFFIALVIAGSLFGWHCYRTGVKRGWDNSFFVLEDEGIIKIDEETLEVKRVSDREFKQFQESMEFSE